MNDDTRTITRLRDAMDSAARGHHLPPDAAARALSEAPRHRPVATYLAIAACLLGVLALALVFAVRDGDDDAAPPATPSCGLSTDPLPTWARAGFTAGGVRTPHVIGVDGEIAAVPFAQPLRVHPAKGSFNKVLWVARDGSAGPLRVEARLGSRVVTRTVDLGPSYLDLPAAGCWRLHLSWPGHSDDLGLRYAP